LAQFDSAHSRLFEIAYQRLLASPAPLTAQGMERAAMTTLVGRRSELAALRRLVDMAGAPTAAEIVGDPGIGKTRLLDELAEHARRCGRLVLRGRAAEFEGRMPFGLVADALDDVDPAALQGEDLGLVRSLRTGPAEPVERYRVHRAVCALLEALARPSGLVLILDDMHWADDGSIELVEYLLRHPVRGRVLLVVAHRPRQTPDHLCAVLARAVRSGVTARVPLRPLTRADVDELFAGEAPERRRRLFAASGGNPFYLGALAELAAGDLVPAAAGAAAEGDVPDSVRSALLAELSRLTPRQLLVARACAVAGDRVEAGLIARTAELDLAEVLPLLDELAAHDVIRPAPSGSRFEFRHPLVRRVAYDAAGAGWRVGAHVRTAAALRAAGAPAAELAHHVERSAQRGDAEAIMSLREAGAATLHRSPAVAAHWLETALRLVPDDPAALLVRLDLLSMTARALVLSGRLVDSREALDELRRLVPAEMAEMRAQATAYGAAVERLLGRHAEARAQLRAALAELPDQDGPAALALKIGLATGVAMRAEPGLDRDWPSAAVAAARRLDDRAALACALALSVVTAHMNGLANEEVAAWLDECATLTDALPDGDLAPVVESLVWLASAETCQERLDDASRHLVRALDIARTTGQSHLVNYIHGMFGARYLLDGQLARAAAHYEDELDAAYLTGSDAPRSLALRNQCMLAIVAGDAENAVRLGREALACAAEGQFATARLATGTLGGAYLLAGDPAKCVELVTEASGGQDLWVVDPVERSNWYLTLARAESALGHAKAAGAWADRAFAHAAGLPRRTGLAHLARAHALLPDDPAAAATEAQRAVELLGGANDRIAAGLANVVAGNAYAASSHGEAASQRFAAAVALFEECGAPHQVENALREQQRVNGRYRLTTRELATLRLLAESLTADAIARRLGITVGTIHKHLASLYRKLGTRDRLETVLCAQRLGLLPAESQRAESTPS
jgi:DNA-binding CsgD family transcriptional regulator